MTSLFPFLSAITLIVSCFIASPDYKKEYICSFKPWLIFQSGSSAK
ncbi:MAG: hypothetical protein H8E46_01880 [FCB group bacterium]|nr:hypothetical protein [FCB group bacterium]